MKKRDIILNIYAKHYDYMIYGSWDMVTTIGQTDGQTDGMMDWQKKWYIDVGAPPKNYIASNQY